MSQQVQELINKIKSEGIQEAQQKSKEIDAQARQDAQKIIDDAKNQAQAIIAKANEDIRKAEESGRMALKQAARDTLLSVRREITHILKQVIAKHVHDTLTPETLADIIQTVVKATLSQQKEDTGVLITLNHDDLEKLKSGAMAKLQHQLKKPIKFQSSADTGKGFTISFDGGKSSFDFTDASLAEYLSAYLNSEVASLAKEAVKS